MTSLSLLAGRTVFSDKGPIEQKSKKDKPKIKISFVSANSNLDISV